ncbi:MAG: hypothetical protein Q9195_004250 [Heterodermia aff. obscurata]
MGEQTQEVSQYAFSRSITLSVCPVLNSIHQRTATVVPKFASFKSKPLSTPSHGTRERGGPEDSRDIDEKQHVTKGPIRGLGPSSVRERQAVGGQSRTQPQDRRDGFLTPVAPSRSIAQLNKNSSNIFQIDRTGDPKNLTYQSLHRSAIPRYRRSGNGDVIGCRIAKIDQRRRTEDRLQLISYWDHHGTERDKNALLAAAHSKTRKLRIKLDQVEDTKFAESAAYIPLRSLRVENKESGEDRNGPDTLSSPDSRKRRYRPFNSRAKDCEGSDGDEHLLSNDSSGSDYENGWQQAKSGQTRDRKTEILKRVEADPSNCDAWLELIDYQEDSIRDHLWTQNSSMTLDECRSNAEVKLSMYENALKGSNRIESKEKLVLGMMEEASKIRSVEALSSKWQEILRAIPGSLILWTRYLDFRQTAFAQFRYEEIRAAFMVSLASLQNSQKDPRISNTERETIHIIEVYVILRLTSFMREAGFSERAVATWQALLEYELYRPSRFSNSKSGNVSCPESTMLSSFEEFWESEVPRIGDEDAMGWASFDTRQGELPHAKIDARGSLDSSNDVFVSWATLELQKTLASRHPARTSDNVEENDPYRIALFSDVRDVLECLPTSSLNPSLLIAGWLAFCHLPPWTQECGVNVNRAWYRDQFLHTETPSWCSSSRDPSDLNSPERRWRDTSDIHDRCSAEVSGHNFQVSPIDHELCPESMFASKGRWFSAFGSSPYEHAPQDGGPVKVDVIRRTLSNLIEADLESNSLAEYLLALEFSFFPGTVRKTAKRLIRKCPENLRLYNAYACIEYRLLNESRAEDVIISAINSSQSLPETLRHDAVYLWRTWVWELLSSDKTKEALERLVAYPDRQINRHGSSHDQDVTEDLQVHPAMLLRAQQTINTSRDYFSSLARPMHTSISCELLILLAYLSNSASLSSAMKAFEASLTALGTRFPSTSPAHELLHQSFARLLYHHATHAPLFKSAAIRESLAASIRIFPHNTILISMYAWNETRFRIHDRVRTIINDVILGSTDGNRRTEDRGSIIPHFFSLHSEFNRSLEAGSNSNTIRNTFEKAVNNHAAAHCVGLWKLYVLFEKSRGDSKKARAVWWRGVQACPWAKALWIMGFQELRDEMSTEELRGVYEMMVEKELRLHVDLIEVLEGKV